MRLLLSRAALAIAPRDNPDRWRLQERATIAAYAAYLRAAAKPEEAAALNFKDNFYHFSFRNIGGLVMPVILKLDYEDGSTETIRIPTGRDCEPCNGNGTADGKAAPTCSTGAFPTASCWRE